MTGLCFLVGLAAGLCAMFAVLRCSRAACRWSGVERAVLDAWYDEEYGCTPCHGQRSPPSQAQIDAIVHDGWPDFLASVAETSRAIHAAQAEAIMSAIVRH